VRISKFLLSSAFTTYSFARSIFSCEGLGIEDFINFNLTIPSLSSRTKLSCGAWRQATGLATVRTDSLGL
jgi:hypothetical protein